MTTTRVCDHTLLAMGLAKLFFVLCFFASFPVVAEAQTAGECRGSNLLTKMLDENPAGYARVIEEAKEIENGQGILWKIEKDGQGTSYLFGTMHMADPQISTLTEDVTQAILNVDSVVIETTDVLDPAIAANAMARLAHLTLLPADQSLSDLVEDSLEAELEKQVTARGIPFSLADRMQPWLIATTVALPVCEMIRKQSGEKVLDAVIAGFGKDNGKPVKGLETTAEQIEAIASLPVDFHVSALEETLAAGDIAVDMSETMKQLYLTGEISKVLPLMKEVSPQSFSGPGAAEFQEALIRKRNVTMAERSLPILAEGTAFIAVGALHLPGASGLVALLIKAGYSVTAVR